jgi:hypothetical protein
MQPFAHVRPGLALAGPPQDDIPLEPRWEQIGFLAQAFGFGSQALF